MKPPFSYYGGKQRMASKIIPYIPKHTVYAEPFCGGATLMFKKPWPDVSNSHQYRDYINDTNKLVVNFFRVLRSDQGKELCNRLELTPYSETEHSLSKEICKNPQAQSKLDLAWAFFVNVNCSFSNQLNCGWGRAQYGANLSLRWNAKNKALSQYLNRMEAVHISNDDALSFIKSCDRPQTFFYCDPPYPDTNQGHYKGYTQEDFQSLVDLASSCEGSFIISSYPQDECFNDKWERVEFSAKMSASINKQTNKKRTEVLYIKQSSAPRAEIQALYDSGKFDCFEGRRGTPMRVECLNP